ncbi:MULTISPECIES: HD-GYP domain-containing protein [unclassified Candidatus Frackibacter]|uniref:HD-GYP domain-containing protein n=1 Tax=unclassified Candidatus Frackibacter TaxID=2648818 RepID=UPI0008845257|nr:MULTISPECIES: HD-GYP domain-containing protein [unclassified Candidatus Frackibacter]SDC71835.1 HD-GYP domain, c-di-GMP phosphodiesterase class II (or its inactivated variant) [Candidatus Frackibacter sp. WG11]SEM86107.1 HD-GYP domain, c-di-GMP phosphodiesterase class II (or its inactivated variant) [Candidatus Frackibacter sp. WG12]SFL95222.1 HD-GYP domain, c-di-GMP phosphodiesterase class II (or its inactivated variant) [Candidatus Frackibacter sp. WG13]
MRKVLTEDLEPGMKVAKTLYLSDGRVLLNAGVILKDSYIDRLKKKDIPALFIADESLPEVEIPEVISDQTRLETSKLLRECMNDIELGNELNSRKIKKAVNEMVDELTSKRHVIVHLNDIRAYDDYTFGHSVNVTALSILTGISLGYNKLELRDLGVGSLLHDVGKTFVDDSILLKPGRLTDEEFKEVQKHSKKGYDIVKDAEGISMPSAHIAYQHHEKYNGTGYPRGLKGDEIIEFAQIVTVADVYDAITTDRVYRNAMPAHEALHVLEDMMQAELNPDIAQTLFKNIAIYPIGSLVELNTGEAGLVVDVNKEDLSSPVVRIISSKGDKSDQQEHDKIIEVDLMHNEEVEIKDVITDRTRKF